jgi:O-antigen/teichoic acid export membrane protein
LILVGATGAILVPIFAVGISYFVTGMGESAVLISVIFSLSNVVMARIIYLAEHIFLAHQEFRQANLINAGFGVARAGAVLIACIGFGVHTIQEWAIWHGGIYLLGSLACVCAAWHYGRPIWQVLPGELPLGVHFSVSSLLLALRQNVDLLALTAVATPGALATYSVARRIVATAIVTGSSFDRLIYTRLADVGRDGASATLRLGMRYLVYATVIAVTTGIGLFLFAPAVPWLFGEQFRGAVAVLRMLCWLLIFVSAQNIAYDALNAADRHSARGFVYNATSICGAVLVVWQTYLHGMSGTIFSLYVSEASIAVALWVTLHLLGRKQTTANFRSTDRKP